jgi:hypothetical protein
MFSRGFTRPSFKITTNADIPNEIINSVSVAPKLKSPVLDIKSPINKSRSSVKGAKIAQEKVSIFKINLFAFINKLLSSDYIESIPQIASFFK